MALPLTLEPQEVLFLPGGVLYLAPAKSDAERDLISLMAACPEPTTESDLEWEAERDEEEWRWHYEQRVLAETRRDDRLLMDAPWLRLRDDDFYLEV